MTVAAFLSFSAAMLILAASPGPGVFAVVSRSLASGFRKSLFLIAGIVTGDLIYLIFAIFGLTFIARNLSQLFLFIRIAGGLYLIWTGIKTFFAPIPERDEQAGGEQVSSISAYFSGLLVTLSNPKAVLFYCGFLPAFVNLETIVLREGFIISLLVISILSCVMMVYSLLASSASRVIGSRSGRRRLNRAAGGVMTTAGVLLIFKK